MRSVVRGVTVYADVPNRLVAVFLDALFLSVLVFVGAAAMALVTGPAVSIDLDSYVATVDRGRAFANAVLSLALGGVYLVGSYLLLGASPGHRLLAMRLRAADGTEGIAPRAAVVRWLLLAGPFGLASAASTLLGGVADLVVWAAALAWYGVLLVTTARHPARQGLHDRAARTIVAKAAVPLATAGVVEE